MSNLNAIIEFVALADEIKHYRYDIIANAVWDKARIDEAWNKIDVEKGMKKGLVALKRELKEYIKSVQNCAYMVVVKEALKHSKQGDYSPGRKNKLYYEEYIEIGTYERYMKKHTTYGMLCPKGGEYEKIYTAIKSNQDAEEEKDIVCKTQ